MHTHTVTHIAPTAARNTHRLHTLLASCICARTAQMLTYARVHAHSVALAIALPLPRATRLRPALIKLIYLILRLALQLFSSVACSHNPKLALMKPKGETFANITKDSQYTCGPRCGTPSSTRRRAPTVPRVSDNKATYNVA